jgi:site-specific DNA-methyltransferase (adenine-specific)
MYNVYYKDDNVTLIQGDCIEVMNSLDEKFDLIVTDPPYGATRNKWDVALPFAEMWNAINRLREPTTPVCLFGMEPFASRLRLSNVREYKYDWYWRKSHPAGYLNSKKQPMRSIECISVFYKKQVAYKPQMLTGFAPYKSFKRACCTTNYAADKDVWSESDGRRFPINLLSYPSNTGGRLHPTQKPVGIYEYMMKTYTDEGAKVLDFTCGVGTALIAGLEQKRKVVGIEIDPEYCESAKNRVLSWYKQHEVKDGTDNT